MSPHGTIGSYINQRCRCDRCRLAKKLYQEQWVRGNGRRQLVGRADAHFAREHAKFLLSNGHTTRSIAARCGVNHSTVGRFATGKRSRISAHFYDRLMGTSLIDAPRRARPLRYWAAA